MTSQLKIMGILVDHRAETSPAVQNVLSEFGDHILMRAGVPSMDRQQGLITLALEAGDRAETDLAGRLGSIEGVTVRVMDFNS